MPFNLDRSAFNLLVRRGAAIVRCCVMDLPRDDRCASTVTASGPGQVGRCHCQRAEDLVALR